MSAEPPLPGDDTRQRILRAAADLFAELGYARTTTRAIAEAAGVNEVTLFRHFGSKNKLLSEMISQHSALPNLSAVIENQLSGDYQQDLILLANIFYRAITERKEALRLMLCEAGELPELREVLVQAPNQLRTGLQRYFQRQIKAGLIPKQHPEVLAQAFMGMFFSYGIAREMLDSKIAPGVSQEKIIIQFVDIFVNGTIKR
ncbi:MAG: TetR/AcrR family transcriptional regulator [Anaerolineales bacterium]|nr:TetR/AcrR family transcriptional regulator [Anaerolineales bacterium]